MRKAIWLLTLSVFLAACGGSGSPTDAEVSPSTTNNAPVGNDDDPWGFIEKLPYEYPSDAEAAAIAFMREEEKLARDVYLNLYDAWGQNIFANIAESEQQHTDATLRLIQKYGLVDPAEGKLEGEFTDPNLQGLYDMLVAQGSASNTDALIVGATIEDLDIYDLQEQLHVVDNEDITQVFENLMRGSRNHLRAFHDRLVDVGIIYVPQYISQQEYDDIVNSPKEAGP